MSGVNSGTLGGTAAILGTVRQTAGRGIVFTYTTSGAETLSVTGLVAGTVVSSKIMCYNLLTGVLHSSVDMVAGTYYIPQIMPGTLIFTASGAADTKALSFLLSDAI